MCANCREERRSKAKQWLVTAGKVAAGIAVVAGAVLLATSASEGNTEDANYPILPEPDNADDDVVYGLGEGNYPTCKTCGAVMTNFDGWAWYTCPICENKVRIIEDNVTWYSEIFGNEKKQHHSDYELADFCRGGDMSED